MQYQTLSHKKLMFEVLKVHWFVNVLFPAYNHYVGCKTVDYKDAST